MSYLVTITILEIVQSIFIIIKNLLASLQNASKRPPVGLPLETGTLLCIVLENEVVKTWGCYHLTVMTRWVSG